MGNKFWIILFIIVALVQLYVPGKMIWNREVVLNKGKEFRFRTAPVDPSNPFMGKYIVLDYAEEEIEVPDADKYDYNEKVFVLLGKDSAGFAKPTGVSKKEPTGNADYVKAEVRYMDKTKINIEYPFNRFYMEESKAYEAEMEYNRLSRDTSQVTYGVVKIKDGEAVLQDVIIGGRSVKEIKAKN